MAVGGGRWAGQGLGFFFVVFCFFKLHKIPVCSQHGEAVLGISRAAAWVPTWGLYVLICSVCLSHKLLSLSWKAGGELGLEWLWHQERETGRPLSKDHEQGRRELVPVCDRVVFSGDLALAASPIGRGCFHSPCFLPYWPVVSRYKTSQRLPGCI